MKTTTSKKTKLKPQSRVGSGTLVMPQLLFEIEKRAAEKSDGEISMIYDDWKDISLEMKEHYKMVARNFGRAVRRRHNV